MAAWFVNTLFLFYGFLVAGLVQSARNSRRPRPTHRRQWRRYRYQGARLHQALRECAIKRLALCVRAMVDANGAGALESLDVPRQHLPG